MYGQRLRHLRKAHKYTMEDIGRKLGIAKSSYGGYEAESKKPPLDKLTQLAEIYDVSIDYILGVTDDPDPKKERKNISEFLEKDNLHWDGHPLSPHEIEPIKQIFKLIVRNK
ncbi:helix-turn-helix domain-containing protein [Bacillus subtilis]|uniref:helix-turn-helix domain-containing protein n=1 Tax=Bacillus subtilis TaxID=1423 RepID=UPI001D07919C|nr:helix-turn-helix transcriptional regulator [Bacillus subtilis]MCB7159990.1 helix-turn-helix domain-containing protein [Bacillus subtilis]MCB7459012.1 helix-turn-helix domain-containing protein [Bacillus subtilis]